MKRAALSLALVLMAAPARADIPPPPDSPDWACTPAEQCPHGTYCPYSRSPGQPAANPAAEICEKAALAKGFEYRCRKGSNYSGQYLFCPKGEKGTWTPPPRPPSPSPSSTADSAPPPPASAPAPANSAPAPAAPKPASRCALQPGPADTAPSAIAALALLFVAALRRARRPQG